MLVKTITDNKSGHRWEIVKNGYDLYTVKYYEYYQAAGWRYIFEDSGYSKDSVEWEFDCKVA